MLLESNNPNINNVYVYGLEESMIASGYPMQTETPKNFDFVYASFDIANLEDTTHTKRSSKLGTTKIGEGHDNFLNGIIVQFDLSFSNKAWVELQRYHFIDFVSSSSTMHRITKFNLDTVYNEYVDPRIVEIMKEKVAVYNADSTPENYLKVLYSNPAGFMLTARMTTNYRQLKTMYYQRKNHRLPEWREFCKWVEELPRFKQLCMVKE